jgi:hypothetical protein
LSHKRSLISLIFSLALQVRSVMLARFLMKGHLSSPLVQVKYLLMHLQDDTRVRNVCNTFALIVMFSYTKCCIIVPDVWAWVPEMEMAMRWSCDIFLCWDFKFTKLLFIHVARVFYIIRRSVRYCHRPHIESSYSMYGLPLI